MKNIILMAICALATSNNQFNDYSEFMNRRKELSASNGWTPLMDGPQGDTIVYSGYRTNENGTTRFTCITYTPSPSEMNADNGTRG